jgi:PAS domain S-box-containing protein
VGSEPPSVPQSQSELDEFFDLALDLMAIVGFDGYVKRMNPAYERTLGYPLRELRSRPFLEFVHPEDRPSVRDQFREFGDGDNDVVGFEHRVICSDGSVRWLQWNWRTMPERGVIFAFGRDVTDRRRADAELREAHRMVEASRDELARLAEEQAALRRVATLVAHGTSPEELFTTVVLEVERVFPAEHAILCRYEPGATMTIVAISKGLADSFPVGSRWPLGNVSAVVFETGRPARIDSYADLSDPGAATAFREVGVRSAVGTPVVVDGRLWGVMTLASTEPLPAATEARLVSFTELLATAIANAESRAGLARLAKEQAALRRVATLVARGTRPEELFTAVTEEIGRLLAVDLATMDRFEHDGTFVIVGTWGGGGKHPPVGSRWPLGGRNLGSRVFETGRPARIDNLAEAIGPLPEVIREAGIRSAVGTPILVEGRLWGLMAAASSQEQPLPPGTEARLASFTELVATAIANAEARTEVAASRARIVAATDEERRRVVRDLHDGAQQRLVTTTMSLKMAQGAVQGGDADVPALLAEALDHAEQATVELRELAHGILPGALTRGGLRAGVAALASRMPVPIDIDVTLGRLPAAVEATAYFVVAEALTNVAKHARAGRAEVTARIEHGTLAVHVRDDGVGGARPDGSGLLGLADRLAALDGKLRVDSPADSGTLVAAAIPLPG